MKKAKKDSAKSSIQWDYTPLQAMDLKAKAGRLFTIRSSALVRAERKRKEGQ